MKKSILLILNFLSCQSNGFLMGKAKATLINEAYPAKDVDAKIDVYIVNKPEY